MKLRKTDDFKKFAWGILIYAITAIVVFPVFHLIKGDFCWEDVFINAGLQIAITVVLGVFFFFGFRIPEKKDH